MNEKKSWKKSQPWKFKFSVSTKTKCNIFIRRQWNSQKFENIMVYFDMVNIHTIIYNLLYLFYYLATEHHMVMHIDYVMNLWIIFLIFFLLSYIWSIDLYSVLMQTGFYINKSTSPFPRHSDIILCKRGTEIWKIFI